MCFRNEEDPLFIEERGASGWRRGRSGLHDSVEDISFNFRKSTLGSEEEPLQRSKAKPAIMFFSAPHI